MEFEDDCIESKLQTQLQTLESNSLEKCRIDEILKLQDTRQLPPFEIHQLELNAKKNWDVVYKKHGTKFFQNRRWMTRKFKEILTTESDSVQSPILLELGCGGGNFFYPILKEVPNLTVWASDFSPRAIELVKSNPDYDKDKVKAFSVDLTIDNCFANFQSEQELPEKYPDFVSAIFVLSYISPDKHPSVVANIAKVTRAGSTVFFRDYGLHDSAQLRFKPGKKISENFYVRCDGTRSYYFSKDVVTSLFTSTGFFKQLECEYIYRRTVNVKEQVDAPRVYVQARFIRI